MAPSLNAPACIRLGCFDLVVLGVEPRIAGKTFRCTADGPEGLVGGKRVIIALARGGFYEEGSALEHLETYLRGVFGFIGIEPEFVRADGINYGPEQREAGIANAMQEAERLAP